jgi:hypothetical protein
VAGGGGKVGGKGEAADGAGKMDPFGAELDKNLRKSCLTVYKRLSLKELLPSYPVSVAAVYTEYRMEVFLRRGGDVFQRNTLICEIEAKVKKNASTNFNENILRDNDDYLVP